MKRAFNVWLEESDIEIVRDHKSHGFNSASDMISSAVRAYVDKAKQVPALTHDQKAYLDYMVRAVQNVPPGRGSNGTQVQDFGCVGPPPES